MIRLNDYQARLLAALKLGPAATEELEGWLRPKFNRSYDATHQALRRLEDRELIRRTQTHPLIIWELTKAGRNALFYHGRANTGGIRS